MLQNWGTIWYFGKVWKLVFLLKNSNALNMKFSNFSPTYPVVIDEQSWHVRHVKKTWTLILYGMKIWDWMVNGARDNPASKLRPSVVHSVQGWTKCRVWFQLKNGMLFHWPASANGDEKWLKPTQGGPSLSYIFPFTSTMRTILASVDDVRNSSGIIALWDIDSRFSYSGITCQL